MEDSLLHQASVRAIVVDPGVESDFCLDADMDDLRGSDPNECDRKSD